MNEGSRIDSWPIDIDVEDGYGGYMSLMWPNQDTLHVPTGYHTNYDMFLQIGKLSGAP